MTTLRELLAQKQLLERQIEQAQRQGRSGAIAAVRLLMSEYGLTVADLGQAVAGGQQPRAVRKVAPKFRNGSTGELWSGRGLQPRWLRSALANGKKISDCAI